MNQSANLLDLPLQILEQICCHLVLDGSVKAAVDPRSCITLTYNYNLSTLHLTFLEPGWGYAMASTEVLRTCRKLYNISTSLIYQTRIFETYGLHSMSLEPQIKSKNLLMVQRLYMHLQERFLMGNLDEPEAFATSLVSHMPSLKDLTLYYCAESTPWPEDDTYYVQYFCTRSGCLPIFLKLGQQLCKHHTNFSRLCFSLGRSAEDNCLYPWYVGYVKLQLLATGLLPTKGHNRYYWGDSVGDHVDVYEMDPVKLASAEDTELMSCSHPEQYQIETAIETAAKVMRGSCV